MTSWKVFASESALGWCGLSGEKVADLLREKRPDDIKSSV